MIDNFDLLVGKFQIKISYSTIIFLAELDNFFRLKEGWRVLIAMHV